MLIALIKSILHNIGVILVGLLFAFIGTRLDLVLGIKDFNSPVTIITGLLLLIIGFLLRVWATFYFYSYHMKVIVLKPQSTLITSGPFSFSRNPLYLGGNLFIFLGAVLLFGSPMGIVLTAVNILVTNLMIRREEKQLEQKFGKQWIDYKKRVHRWL